MKEVFFDIRDGIESLVVQSKEALGFEKEKDREQDVKQSLGRGDEKMTLNQQIKKVY